MSEPSGTIVCGEEVLFRASSYGVFVMPDGSSREHYGVDLYAPRGTDARCPVVGVVDRVGLARDGKPGGNRVRIKDATREYHYAAHLLTSPLVKRGDEVAVGTPLGWVGRTGSAAGTRSHTHYEWRDRWGRPKNPYRALLRAYGMPADLREARGPFDCPGGPLGCEGFTGDAALWCSQAAELLAAKEPDDGIEVAEWPPSSLGDRPIRWDIIAGVGAATALIFGATTGGWFVRRRAA
jgi:hypothetical protein